MEPGVNTWKTTDTDETEIDLLEIARLLWQKIWMIGLGFIVGAAVLFGVSRFYMTPQYSAESIIYIFSKSTSISQLADLQIGTQLTGDFTIIATTREVLESVIEKLGLDTSYEQMKRRVTVTNPTSSHMLNITVVWENPATAANICNVLADELREQISDIMNQDKPSVVQRAVVPMRQSKPDIRKNTIIGALAGALLVAAIIIIRYLMDDTIKTDEDVTKYLKLNTLASFPYMRIYDDQRKKRDEARRKVFKGSRKGKDDSPEA